MRRETATSGPCAAESGGSCRCHPCQGTPSRLPVSTSVSRQFSRQSQALGLLELPQFSKLASTEERALRALLLWSTQPLSPGLRGPEGVWQPPGARQRGGERLSLQLQGTNPLSQGDLQPRKQGFALGRRAGEGAGTALQHGPLG